MNKITSLLVIIGLFAFSCTSKKDNNPSIDSTIKLKFTTKLSGLIGYGSTYACIVKEVVEGNLKQDSFTMTILANDQKFQATLEHSKEFLGEFVKNKTNEPYQLAPINGFVDENKTSWKLTSIK